jgi:metal-responsive CopG/Arc/MetJ family transcriptional regulator
MTARKLKVSLTLSADLLELVDRRAHSRGETRSGVVEEWLRRAAAESVAQEIDDATAAYYLALRGDELAEEEHIARAISRAARRVDYDGGAAKALAKRARR